MANRTENLLVEGMQCIGCEGVIEQALAELPGVVEAQASYATQRVVVVYDDSEVGLSEIETTIAAKGYALKRPQAAKGSWLKRSLLFLSLLLAVGGVAYWGKSQMPHVMQLMQPQMDDWLLLGVGFLTGFHCIGMCGSFVVGYTDVRQSKVRQLLAHVSYGLAKTLSYTLIGAGFGWLGAMVAITPTLRGGLALAAAVFLLLYGLRMLNLFAVLRRFVLRLPAAVNRELNRDIRQLRSPFLTGLFSGLLLGCGPLQAMYVMAAGSGDPWQGGTILLLFGLGTLLPLWGFGLFAALLSANAMRQLVRVSGILVIAMGLMMAQRGLALLQGGAMPGMANHSMHSMH